MVEKITIGRPLINSTEGVYYTNIVVEPPVVPGEGFEETIIGQNASDVSLSYIANTNDASIFEVRTGSPRTKTEHRLTLKHVADRIVQLAAEPGNAVHMKHDVAFSYHAETAWGYSDRNNSSLHAYELVLDPSLRDLPQKV